MTRAEVRYYLHNIDDIDAQIAELDKLLTEILTTDADFVRAPCLDDMPRSQSTKTSEDIIVNRLDYVAKLEKKIRRLYCIRDTISIIIRELEIISEFRYQIIQLRYLLPTGQKYTYEKIADTLYSNINDVQYNERVVVDKIMMGFYNMFAKKNSPG